MSDISSMSTKIEDETEISPIYIFHFIQENWRSILVAGIVGVTLGLGNWLFLTNYKVNLLLQNSGIFDVVSWRSTEKILPNLALQMVNDNSVSRDQIAFYKKISNPDWWAKNVQVNFALTKRQTKEFASLTKELDSASANIISFEVSLSAPTEAEVREEIHTFTQFLINGSLYIDIKNLLNDFEYIASIDAASAQKEISTARTDLVYLNARLKKFEDLQKRTPQSISSNQDLGDRGLISPILAKVVEITAEIATKEELIERSTDMLIKSKTYKNFLESAAPLIVGRYDATAVVKELLIIEEKMRAKTPPGDYRTLKNLDLIRFEVLKAGLRFDRGLSQKSVSDINASSGILKNAATGLVVASFSMLFFLLSRRVLKILLLQKHSQKST